MKPTKELEIRLKNAFSSTIRSLLSQPSRRPMQPFRRMLFIRYGGIGDMILSLPVLRAVRLKYPHARVDVLCDKKNVAPLEGTGLADQIFYYEKNPLKLLRLLARLKRRSYDIVVNLVLYPSFTFGLISRIIASNGVRVAGNQNEFAYLYNRTIELPDLNEVHMLNNLSRMVSDLVDLNEVELGTPWVHYGSEIEDKAEALFKQALSRLSVRKSKPRIVAINFSAGLERREWPEKQFVEFLKIVVERHKQTIDGWVAITDPRKPHRAAEIVRAVDKSALFVLPVVEDFRVLMLFLRRAWLLVSPDTSLVHAASAMGTAVLDLIIGENKKKWSPIGVPYQNVSAEDPLRITGLPVQDVVSAFENLIELLS